MIRQLLRKLDPVPGDYRVKAVMVNELFERFCYYGSRAVLALYMNERLGFDEPTTVSLFAYYIAACYFSPLIGGYIGDVYWGKYRTIVVFNFIYMSGLLILGTTAFVNSTAGCFIGLGLMALGTGGIKPSCGPFGADQLPPGDAQQNTSFWLAWYAAINLGSVFSYILTPIVRVNAGYGWAFLTSLFALVFSLAVFLLPTAAYTYVPPTGSSVYATIYRVLKAAASASTDGATGGGSSCSGQEHTPLIVRTGPTRTAVVKPLSLGPAALPTGSVSAIAMRSGGGAGVDNSSHSYGNSSVSGNSTPATPAFGADNNEAESVSMIERQSSLSKTKGRGRCCCFFRVPSCLQLERARGKVSDADIAGVAAFLGLMPLFSCLPIFWALFDSMDSLWTLQRKHMNVCLSAGGLCLTTEQFGVLNPLLVIIFVPLMDKVVIPVLQSSRHAWLHPTPLRRMTIGMQLAAGAFAITAAVQARIDAAGDGVVPVGWQLPMYVVMTTAEMLVSATGLEFAYSQAPPSMRGTVMAMFFLTTFVGDTVNGLLYNALSAVLTPLQLLILLSALMSLAGVVFGVLAYRYQPVDTSAWMPSSSRNQENSLAASKAQAAADLEPLQDASVAAVSSSAGAVHLSANRLA